MLTIVALLIAGCSAHVERPESPEQRPGLGREGAAARTDAAGQLPRVGPIPATVVNLKDVPTIDQDPSFTTELELGIGRRPRGLISEEQAENLRAAAKFLPPSPRIQNLGAEDLRSRATLAGGFDGPDRSASGNIPPDPELAVGPGHVIAAVNVYFSIYTTGGVLAAGPIQFSDFFSPIPGCTSAFTNLTDPNVLYDEAADRFFLAIDAITLGGYCFAVSQTSNPIGGWNLYAFATVAPGDTFDYPHAGIGEEAIFMGANVFFGAGGVEGRVWAIDKSAAYAGTLTFVTHSTGSETTPQPMNLHGFQQGTWPSTGRHYILTDDAFNGNTFGVWSWDDPFGADVFVDRGAVDLAAATGVLAGFPINAPQAGSAEVLQANDWRVQDAEYRNGNVWMSHGLSCNPGGGTVDCVRWAEIDPTAPSVIQAGVFASPGEFRIFPDLAVNHCDDMTLGYTKTGTGLFPGVYFTGRLGSDPPGSVHAEGLLRAGEGPYTFSALSPHRWGDYSGATSDPGGTDTWYLGEYSKTSLAIPVPWGNYVGRFSTTCSPCFQTQSLTAGVWELVSLPCDVGGLITVDEAFGDDLGSADHNLRWAIFERDAANEQYIQLDLNDPLSQGRGYWIETLDPGKTIGITGVTSSGIDTPLVSEATEGRLNMVGHPFDFKVCWADVQVVDGGSPLTLAQADPAIGMTRACLMDPPDASCVMSRIAYKWNGAAYQVFDGETLGAEGELESFDGLWVRAFKSSIALRVPALESANCGLGGPPPLPIAPQGLRAQSGWAVRLIAQAAHPGTAPLAARALRDAGNVLGQLPDSEPGYDRHDLEEPAPFAAPFLTVVFPHDDWGASSGVYTTDFHPLDPQQPDAWRFEVQASADVGRVTLTWEGSETVLRGAELLDEATGRRFAIKPGGSFSFEIAGASRSFRWLFPGSPGDGGGVPSL